MNLVLAALADPSTGFPSNACVPPRDWAIAVLLVIEFGKAAE